MKKLLCLIFFMGIFSMEAQYAVPDIIKTSTGKIEIQPVLHSSLILKWNSKTIFVDPYKELSIYGNVPSPAIILITDIHGDHLNLKTIEKYKTPSTIIVVPEAVKEKLPTELHSQLIVLKNGELKSISGITVEAIPMYNLPENEQSRHVKGRGNGYVLTIDKKRIYISGDTADIPEMRTLKNIDIAFVCMNLPYTMDFETAADAVLDFKPKIVYPYHFRGKDGFSDIEAFKAMVFDKNPDIEVRNRIWYPEN